MIRGVAFLAAAATLVAATAGAQPRDYDDYIKSAKEKPSYLRAAKTVICAGDVLDRHVAGNQPTGCSETQARIASEVVWALAMEKCLPHIEDAHREAILTWGIEGAHPFLEGLLGAVRASILDRTLVIYAPPSRRPCPGGE